MVKEEDIISNLPEHILHHILSFLEMKFVVRTCILSKRWTSLWKTLPSLNFDFDTHYNIAEPFKYRRREGFTDFLYNVLTLRDISSNITSFRLAYSFFNMEAWMHFVTLRHNVQVLDIYIKTNHSVYLLPHCLFNCKSLVTLKLNIREDWMVSRVPVFVHLPKSVNLPSLRALHLQSFRFNGGNKFVQKLISASPVLDTLSIINCGLCDTYTLTICSTQLKHLELDGIYACDCCGGMYILERCKILISAPLLTSFKCRGYLWNDYLVEDLPSLYKADIDMDVRMTCETADENWVMDSSQREEFGRNMMKFLGVLSNANSLTLSPCLLLEVIQQAMGTSSISFPVPKQLKLKMGPYRDCILGIKYMLQIFHNLETLILEIPTANIDPAKSYEYWEVGFCNFHHIRFVELRNAMGCINELKFLELLLKYAIALEKLVIFFWKERSPSSQRHITEFTEILLAFPRASPNVAMLFF